MSQFEDWQNRSGKYGAKIWGDMTREPKTSAVDSGLRKAVAYYLYIQWKDVPDDEAGLYRATALALLRKPVDPALLAVASARKSIDDPLYANGYGDNPTLDDVWEYHHRTEIG